ncbi:MAG: hypothetical protein JRD93_05595 [Deltaproteobacteria bacterium]|nr:hypothetical protein [Deltaproteobacteria bacterium]
MSLSIKKKAIKKAISVMTMIMTVTVMSNVGFLNTSLVMADVVDGALIKSNATNPDGTPSLSSLDVYIVKLVGTKKFKRLVLNPTVFNSYGHLNWGDIQTVSQSVIDEYTTSALVRVDTDPDEKVYAMAPENDTGKKSWVNVTSAEFLGVAGSEGGDSIYTINATDGGSYTAVGDLTTVTQLETFYSAGTLPDAPAVGAGLTVSLGSNTPASSNIAKGSSMNFTELVFTNGTGDTTISKIYITRYGLSNTSDVENVKLVDADGVQWGSTASSLGSTGKATLFFTTPLSIAANTSKTYLIRAGAPSGAGAGNTVAFGIASVDDIVSSATITGSFPIQGNAMSIAGLTIGTVSVATDGTITDSTPDIGDTRVLVNKFKVTAGSTEGVVIENMTLLESGSTASSDTANIELFDVTDNVSLGTVANWNSEGKAAFTGLNIDLAKGETHRFRLYVDVLNGSGLTINADFIDGSDVLMNAKGASYGFYITPTILASWNGKGAADQTINSGSLTISKSNVTPATGNITEADSQRLTTFDFEAKGEEVIVSSTKITMTVAGEADGADFINCVLVDVDGVTVAGPGDVTDALDYVTFSEMYIVPVGVNQYSVECTVFDSDADDWSTGSNDTVIAGIAAAGDVTAKGYTTGTAIVPGGSYAANGNTQTIKFGVLAATTLTTPAARSIVDGASDVTLMEGAINANNSGEDVVVDTIIIEDTISSAGSGTDVDNLEIWADLDDNGSYETKVSNTEQLTGANLVETTLSFTLTAPITVEKDTEVRVALIGDFSTAADTGDEHTFSFDTDAGDVSGTGTDTGTTIEATPTGDGQKITIAAAGTLTVSVDSSSPTDYTGDTDYLVEANVTKETLAVFKLKETSGAEALELDTFKITDGGSDVVATKYYLYASARADGGSTADPIAEQTPVDGLATFYVSDGAVEIPADGSVKLTVKGDIANVDGTTVANENTLQVTVAAANTDVVTHGLSSGTTVNGASSAYNGPFFILLSSVPTVTFADGWGDNYNKTLNQGTSVQIARVQVTAGAKDISFDNANTPYFNIQITASAKAPGYSDGGVVIFKSDGVTLQTTGTIAYGNAGAIIQADCEFTADWIIPAGETRYLDIYADTTEFITAGDTLQVSLDETAADVTFSIESNTANYAYGKILNRGIQYGASFSK